MFIKYQGIYESQYNNLTIDSYLYCAAFLVLPPVFPVYLTTLYCKRLEDIDSFIVCMFILLDVFTRCLYFCNESVLSATVVIAILYVATSREI